MLDDFAAFLLFIAQNQDKLLDKRNAHVDELYNDLWLVMVVVWYDLSDHLLYSLDELVILSMVQFYDLVVVFPC